MAYVSTYVVEIETLPIDFDLDNKIYFSTVYSIKEYIFSNVLFTMCRNKFTNTGCRHLHFIYTYIKMVQFSVS